MSVFTNVAISVSIGTLVVIFAMFIYYVIITLKKCSQSDLCRTKFINPTGRAFVNMVDSLINYNK